MTPFLTSVSFISAIIDFGSKSQAGVVMKGIFIVIFPVVSDKETGILSTKSEEDDFKEENSYIYNLMYREEQVKEGNYLEI